MMVRMTIQTRRVKRRQKEEMNPADFRRSTVLLRNHWLWRCGLHRHRGRTRDRLIVCIRCHTRYQSWAAKKFLLSAPHRTAVTLISAKLKNSPQTKSAIIQSTLFSNFWKLSLLAGLYSLAINASRFEQRTIHMTQEQGLKILVTSPLPLRSRKIAELLNTRWIPTIVAVAQKTRRASVVKRWYSSRSTAVSNWLIDWLIVLSSESSITEPPDVFGLLSRKKNWKGNRDFFHTGEKFTKNCSCQLILGISTIVTWSLATVIAQSNHVAR